MSKYDSAEAADAWYSDQKAEAFEKGITMKQQLAPHMRGPVDHNYLFDVKCFVTRRVDATNEAEARHAVIEWLESEGWTPDGELDLIEVDGEAT